MEEKIKDFDAWVARDENRILFMYTSKPIKDKSLGIWYNLETNGIKMNEDDDLSQIKWEDEEPTKAKVELTIKICK